MFQRLVVGLFALLSVFPALAAAQDSPTFYRYDTQTRFSVNLGGDGFDATQDSINSANLYFYFSSPAKSWVSIGFGPEMKGSFMLVFYPSQNGKNVTVSPRTLDGEWYAEPALYSWLDIELLPGTGIVEEDGQSMMVVKAICRHCEWLGPVKIDRNDTSFPMIYAYGPDDQVMRSNDLNAPLSRHDRYGTFTMDMTMAAGKVEVPTPAAVPALVGVKFWSYPMIKDRDMGNLAHAVLGCLAIFVLWPLNVVAAEFCRRIGIHVGVSAGIMVCLVVAYALGIWTSYQFNRSKNFNSAHQIAAFIAFIPLLLTNILPLPSIAKLSPHIPRLHTPLVSLTLALLILTGGLGLHLSPSTRRPVTVGYIMVSLVVFAFCVALSWWVKRRGSAHKRADEKYRQLRGDEQSLGLKNFGPEALEGGSGGNGIGGHERSGDAGSSYSGYGGGAMPGPQYMLNMHPGVPVHKM